MERESFERGEIAKAMNEPFVCIKVGRQASGRQTIQQF